MAVWVISSRTCKCLTFLAFIAFVMQFFKIRIPHTVIICRFLRVLGVIPPTYDIIKKNDQEVREVFGVLPPTHIIITLEDGQRVLQENEVGKRAKMFEGGIHELGSRWSELVKEGLRVSATLILSSSGFLRLELEFLDTVHPLSTLEYGESIIRDGWTYHVTIQSNAHKWLSNRDNYQIFLEAQKFWNNRETRLRFDENLRTGCSAQICKCEVKDYFCHIYHVIKNRMFVHMHLSL